MTHNKLYYDLTTAMRISSDMGIYVTRPTMVSWIKQHSLGFQPGGKNSLWYIYKREFDVFILGKTKKEI